MVQEVVSMLALERGSLKSSLVFWTVRTHQRDQWSQTLGACPAVTLGQGLDPPCISNLFSE